MRTHRFIISDIVCFVFYCIIETSCRKRQTSKCSMSSQTPSSWNAYGKLRIYFQMHLFGIKFRCECETSLRLGAFKFLMATFCFPIWFWFSKKLPKKKKKQQTPENGYSSSAWLPCIFVWNCLCPFFFSIYMFSLLNLHDLRILSTAYVVY